MAEPVTVLIEDDTETVHVDPVTGTVTTDQPDGGKVVQLDARRQKDDDDGEDFYANLVDEIGTLELGGIANSLMDAIDADNRSRQGYLAVRSRGIDLLGLKLEEPKATIGDSSSGVEGMSSVTNPLLLEAVLKGWANAQAELLPANGPVKVRDDGKETLAEDDLAESLERDLNHYLTTTASEYYPDTSHMLLWGVYFGGSGFKKVYRCPMRRRPVSETVDAKDLIVSDTTKDLKSCARITHEITMRPSVMKRMMHIGAYRDISLTQPTPTPTAVDTKLAQIQGTQPKGQSERPEDQPYTIWECQCELDIPQFAPGKFKDEGIPLPYLVTIDHDSREILSIRRDWREEDEECERQRMYVKYPYVPGPGFYGTGMLNILGNCSAAMTAAWREALDAGMFASFPGGLIAKLAGRQNSSNFRVAPGEYQPIETNGQPINQTVMPMPYRDVTPGLMTMMDKVVMQAHELGGVADIPASEGIQNIPVGTMLASIEQATKIMAAAHKGMHQAMSEEIELLVELFRDNPEDFWRFNKITPADYWNEEKFAAALNNCNLVPVSDPNVPSHIHRVMKALALIQLVNMPIFAGRFDVKEVQMRCLDAIREDPQGLVIDPAPTAAPPDPNMIKAQAAMMSAQTAGQKAQADLQMQDKKLQLEAYKMAMEKQTADAQVAREQIIHQADQAKLVREDQREQQSADLEARKHQFEQDHAMRQHALDLRQQNIDALKSHHEAQLASGGAVSEHVQNMHQRHVEMLQHQLEMGKAAHQMQLERHQHALAVAQHHSEHTARMRELDNREKEIAVKKIAAEKPAPRPVARAMGGAVWADEPEPIAGLGSGNETADLMRALIETIKAPKILVRDKSGRPIGARLAAPGELH